MPPSIRAASFSPILLAGPTAVGKSAVALLLAERLGGEIISVDSMQVYRGLDIGTAKPGPQERSRVPHHLIDIIELTDSFDAAQFARLGQKAVVEIQARGRVPILCGGTGLYFKAFLEGLGEAPPANAVLRAELAAIPLTELLGEIKSRDPRTFETIDRKNLRRVIRAVEVMRLTGKPFSEQRATWNSEQNTNSPPPPFFGLERPLTDLRFRIDARVDQMFERGLVRETEGLLQRGLEQNHTAMQAIGYRQVVQYLRKERSLAETISLVKLRTRQFAKRQMTWFRRQAQMSWIPIDAEQSPEKTAELLIRGGSLPRPFLSDLSDLSD